MTDDIFTQEPTVVVLIHGIRTDAVWQERVTNQFKRAGLEKVVPIRYGYLDLIRFWLPGVLRRKAVDVVEWKIQRTLTEFPNHKVAVVAHSFGTYALVQTLLRNPLVRLHKLILCGSIVPENFQWSDIAEQIEGNPSRRHIINECGGSDVWPILAGSTSFGYGASGTFGFGSAEVTDRFHNFRHSDYFNETFVDNYWIPFILSGEIVASPWENERPATPTKFKLLRLPFNFAIAASIGLLVLCGAIKIYAYVFDWHGWYGEFVECRSHIVYPTKIFEVTKSDREPGRNMLVTWSGDARVYLNSTKKTEGKTLGELAHEGVDSVSIDYEASGPDWYVLSGFYTGLTGREYEFYVCVRESRRSGLVHRYELVHDRPDRDQHGYWNLNEMMASTLRSDGGGVGDSYKECWL